MKKNRIFLLLILMQSALLIAPQSAYKLRIKLKRQ